MSASNTAAGQSRRDSPAVSIGVPVFNDARYLPETLDSWLNQDYPNLEIIVSDNASTDETPEICRTYAAADKRIRYISNLRNVGSIQNFNQLFCLSRGKFFMWSGSHDRFESNFVSICAAELESNPKLVLCTTPVVFTDQNGTSCGESPATLDTRGMSSPERFLFIARAPSCFATYGLMRADAVKKTSVVKTIYFSDFLFLTELCLQGEFSFTTKTHAIMRTFPSRDREQEADPSIKITRLLSPTGRKSWKAFIMGRFPFWQLTLHTLKTLYSTRFSLGDKLKITWGVLHRWRGSLVSELTTQWLPKPLRRFLRGLS